MCDEIPVGKITFVESDFGLQEWRELLYLRKIETMARRLTTREDARQYFIPAEFDDLVEALSAVVRWRVRRMNMVNAVMGTNGEAAMMVNGQALEEGDVLTIRVALMEFFSRMDRPTALGDDAHGRAMVVAYRQRAERILLLMRSVSPPLSPPQVVTDTKIPKGKR